MIILTIIIIAGGGCVAPAVENHNSNKNDKSNKAAAAAQETDGDTALHRPGAHNYFQDKVITCLVWSSSCCTEALSLEWDVVMQGELRTGGFVC